VIRCAGWLCNAACLISMSSTAQPAPPKAKDGAIAIKLDVQLNAAVEFLPAQKIYRAAIDGAESHLIR